MSDVDFTQLSKDVFNGMETDEEYWVTDVLRFPELTWEDQESLCAVDCIRCSVALDIGKPVWVWGEPFGLKGVALKTYCSDDCARQAVDEYVDEKIQRDYVVRWRSM